MTDLPRPGRRRPTLTAVRRVGPLLLPVLVPVLALATSCAGGAPEPGPSPAAAPVDLGEPGPLEAYLGLEAATASDVLVDAARRENGIAACMAKQGFEYWPLIPAGSDVVAGEGPARGTRAFAEAYGYGIWVTPDGEPGQFTYEVSGGPNQDYVEGLSEGAREAYETALHGPVLSEDENQTTRGGGCMDTGAVGAAAGDVAYLAGVEAEAWRHLTGLGTDSRFADVDAAWASCMADAGHAFPTPEAAYLAVVEEVTTAPAEVWQDEEELARRAAEEQRLALADLGCQEATDWAARHRAIELELQQEYVDEHRADLEALAEALASVADES